MKPDIPMVRAAPADLPLPAAARVYPVAQIHYWQDNGGVTYQDPDGREVVFASWVYGPP
jgi:hypothetical protein